jgi:recombination protein RecA
LAKKTTKKVNTKPVDINLADLSGLAADAGLVVLRDSEHAHIADRLPLFLPSIDRILGGGLPFGRLIEVAGVPSGGKSTLAFHAARVGTAIGCIVVLIDVEGTADRERLSELGIDVSRVMVKQPDPDSGIDLTVEEIGKTIEDTLKVFKEKYPHVPVIYVWDSVGQTPSKVELQKDYGEQNVGARAKAITQFVTKISPLIAQTKSMLFAINQVRDDIGGNAMFKTYKVPGGKAWEHAASLRIEIKKKSAIKKRINGDDQKVGHQIGVYLQKSKISRPHQMALGWLISDSGIDYEVNLVEMGKEAGVVEAPGQSYQFVTNDGEIVKKKRDDFIDFLRTPEGQPVREDILNQLVTLEFPDGYTALKNETLDISGWMDTVHPPKVVTEPAEAVSDTGGSGSDADALLASVQAEIDGEKG